MRYVIQVQQTRVQLILCQTLLLLSFLIKNKNETNIL